MARWYYRSVFDDLEDLRDYLESLNRRISGGTGGMLLPAAGNPPHMMLPAYPETFSVRVSETHEDVVVTAAMMAGVTKEDLSLDLTSSRELEITYSGTRVKRNRGATFVVQERVSETVTKIVSLPEPVTKEGSSAQFRDGTLVVCLKKARLEPDGKISIRQ